MLRCCICGESTHVNRLEECNYVALGEPCCSRLCHERAYSLDRFDGKPFDGRQYELAIHINPG